MDPQRKQVYGGPGKSTGPAIGTPGNGLGRISGTMDAWDEGIRKPRPSDASGMPLEAPESLSNVTEGQDDPETYDLLYEALQRLSARQCFVIRLRYGLGGIGSHSLAEIAELMGTTTQAVSDLEQRGLKALHKSLRRGTENA